MAASIAATLELTPEEFRAWVYQANPEAPPLPGNNALGSLDTPFDFPTYPEPPINETTAYPANCHEQQCQLLDADSDPGYVRYGHCCPPVIDNPRRYPRVEHLSVAVPTYDGHYTLMLAFLNGSVIFKLKDEPKGTATISFGTQIWPDGTKLVFGWVTNLHLPKSQQLGENQRTFTTDGVIATISQTHLSGIPQTPSCSREKRDDLLNKLQEDIGKPVGIELFPNDELRMWPDQSVPGDCSESPEIDATIQGVDTNQFVPVFQALIRTYFDQDPAAFSSAIQQGIQEGLLIDSALKSSAELEQALRRVSKELIDLESVFMHFPLGRTVFIRRLQPLASLIPVAS